MIERGKIMKKIFAALLLFVFILSACGNKKADTDLVSVEESEIVSSEHIIEESSEEIKERSIYSGRELSEKTIKSTPIFVMIDNAKPARPQANLSKASIIWEMRVEGADTRYMALFERPEEGDSFLLGPIRSARPNFINRANQHGGILLHHGASSDGDKLIKELGMKNLDGMTLIGKLHFRYKETRKRAPHNSYAYIDKAFDLYESKGGNMMNNGKGFLFNEEFQEPSQGEMAKKVNVRYSKLDDITYEYVEADKNYRRYREGKLMKDELTAAEVRATNIIVQIADSYIYDKNGHQAFKDVGKGDGYLITAGRLEKITWTKSEGNSETTKFLDGQGNEIKLNPGQTWIQVVDKKMKFKYE